MNNKIYFILFLSAFLSFFAKAQPNFAIVGFATQNGGTTGGQGGTTVTATTYAQLKSYAESATTYIIKVQGTISNGTSGGQIRVKSNKSIIGEGSTAFLSGVGIDIGGSDRNIIIQNLKITLVGVSNPSGLNGGDCIGISGSSKNIWIDHCEIYSENPNTQTNIDKYDGLLDIKGQTGFITVSWCYFHDHHKGCLVGAGEDDLYADRKITYHHNYFNNVKLRVPMYRGGTGHFFNNYIKDAKDASEIRNGACVRIEKNYYENFNYAIYTPSDYKGSTERIDNYLSKTQSRAYPANCTASIPYSYSNVLTTTTADVKSIVTQYAGVGKLGTCTASTWYADADNDGFGDPNSIKNACTQPAGYVANKTDLCPADANKTTAGQCGCGVAETVCMDCQGVKNGTATLDNCGRCIGGTTGKTACVGSSELETENCAIEGITETKNTGFTGTGYVNVDNAIGTTITFGIVATTAGNATISFRYANGGTSDRTAQVSLNGTVLPNTLSFPVTGTFTDWKTVDLTLNLLAGNNIIKLISYTADGQANIDNVGYVTSGLSKGGCVVTALDFELSTLNVKIYPNPSKASFRIQTSSNIDIKIADLEGRIIEEHKSISEIELGENLKPGVYFVKVGSKMYKVVKE